MRFEARHNMIALLDSSLPEASSYLDMIAFLRRSRIFRAISKEMPLCILYLTSFWESAVYHCEMIPPTIVGTVGEHEVHITENAIRDALEFNDVSTDPTEYPYSLIIKVFERMGYSGDFSDSQLRKAKLSFQWRFLAHVLIQSISPRKTGFDGITRGLQSALVALALNKKFNFSRFVFENLKENLSTRGRNAQWMLYPRFLMITFKHLLPDLPMLPQVYTLNKMTKRVFADCKQACIGAQPRNLPLFGHPVNPDYIEPPNDGWINEEEEGEGVRPSSSRPTRKEGRTKFKHDKKAKPRSKKRLAAMAQVAEESSSEEEEQEVEQENSQSAEQVESEKSKSSQSSPSQSQHQTMEISSSEETESEEEPQLKRRRVVQEPEIENIQRDPSPTPPVPAQAPAQAPTPSSVPEDFIIMVSEMRSSIHELRSKIDNQDRRINEQDEKIKSLEAEIARLTAQEEPVQNTEVVNDSNENEENENDEQNDNDEENDDGDKNDDDNNDDDDHNEGPGGAILIKDDKNEKDAEDDKNEDQEANEQDHESNECWAIVPYVGSNEQANEEIERLKEIELTNDDLMFDSSILDILNYNVEEEAIEEDLVFSEREEEEEDKRSTTHEIIFEDQSIELNEYVLPSGEIITENELNDDEIEQDEDILHKEESKSRADEPEGSEPRKEKIDRSGWFRPQVEVPSRILNYESDVSRISGLILSWKYEESLNLICVKRRNGIQYFKNDRETLSSLPQCELWHLSSINMINRSNNGTAAYIERKLREEANTGFKTFKPAVGKRRIYKKKVDKRTGKPLVKLVFPPAKSLKKIPLIQLPLNCLKNFKSWSYYGTDAEAVIERTNEDDIYIYDPITLINFSEADLMILYKNPILYHRQEKDMAMTYQRVVRLCVKKGIHAGSLLPSQWK